MIKKNEDNLTAEEKNFINRAYTFKEQLIRIGQVKLGNIYDAEDAVDEAILKAAKKRDQLQEDSKLAPWLKRITLNHCNDILKSKKNEASIEKIEPVAEESHHMQDPADRIEIVDEIERLLDLMLAIEPQEHSEVLILFYYRQLQYNEIGEELSIPVGTVKSRLNRARESLVHEMKKQGFTTSDIERIKDLSRWPAIKFSS